MPLQTAFYDKVTAKGTKQLYPLGTIRVEGNKVYKYVKSSGIINNNDVATAAAAGTVKVTGASLKGIGVNSTGADTADGEYFWMQVAGETNAFDSSGATGVGYPLYAVDATGLMSGTAASASAVGTSTIAVDNATGYAVLAGLL